jgi:hypothetical protein
VNGARKALALSLSLSLSLTQLKNLELDTRKKRGELAMDATLIINFDGLFKDV